MESATDCPACLEKYVDPRQLPCGHTCLNCLESIRRKKRHIKCRVCQNMHRIPESGERGFSEDKEMVKKLLGQDVVGYFFISHTVLAAAGVQSLPPPPSPNSFVLT